ncbi:hypothetical protein [Ruegeria sp. MALMAid1280]|uniref:hypothetical protein n=1 Tax=Ruegeria sp. MALMAid1280 TaxID=3411634 RepID=UPI003BA23746
MRQNNLPDDLDEITVAAVKAGRAFGTAWGDYPKLVNQAASTQETLQTVDRLKSNDVFNSDDEDALDEVEKQLVAWFEALPGRRYLELDSRAGVLKVIETDEAQEVLNLLLQYLAFRRLRQEVVDRMTAKRVLMSFRNT